MASGFVVALTAFTQMIRCNASWLRQATFWWRDCCHSVLEQSNTDSCASALSRCLSESDFFTLLWRLCPAWPACLTPVSGIMASMVTADKMLTPCHWPGAGPQAGAYT